MSSSTHQNYGRKFAWFFVTHGVWLVVSFYISSYELTSKSIVRKSNPLYWRTIDFDQQQAKVDVIVQSLPPETSSSLPWSSTILLALLRLARSPGYKFCIQWLVNISSLSCLRNMHNESKMCNKVTCVILVKLCNMCNTPHPMWYIGTIIRLGGTETKPS